MPSAVSRLRSQVRQNGVVVDAMIPNVVPSGSRNRSAGAELASRERLDRAVPRRQALQDLGARDHLLAGPVGGAAHVHVLDEPHLGADRAGELQQVDQLVVVDAPDDDGVELEAREPGRPAGLDARQDRGVLVPPGERPEPIGPEGVEADRDPVEPGLPERRGLRRRAARRWSSSPGPGRPATAPAAATRSGQVPPQQGLAAGEPDLVDAELGEDVRPAAGSPRRSGGPRAAARRTPPPACSTGSGGCTGRSPTPGGSGAAGRACPRRGSTSMPWPPLCRTDVDAPDGFPGAARRAPPGRPPAPVLGGPGPVGARAVLLAFPRNPAALPATPSPHLPAGAHPPDEGVRDGGRTGPAGPGRLWRRGSR